ncbi:MAG: DUF6714 family protein [Myxococcota bacterium]
MDLLELWSRGPDAWDGWLVHADRLAEAGDERGEWLQLEHRLRTGAVTGPEAVDVRDYLDECVDIWVSWTELAEEAEDLEDALACARRMRPLVDLAPEAVRPTLVRPDIQLVATVVDGRSAIVAPHHRAQLDAVITWIDRAFDGVPPPDADHVTLRQAEAADSYAVCGQEDDVLGRWQDLPDSELLANQWAFAHLDAMGVHHYLPAILCFWLRHHTTGGHPDDVWVCESVEYSLQRSSPELRAHQRGRFARLDHDQRVAIAAFCAAVGHERAGFRWMAAIERPDGDWYARFEQARR